MRKHMKGIVSLVLVVALAVSILVGGRITQTTAAGVVFDDGIYAYEILDGGARTVAVKGFEGMSEIWWEPRMASPVLDVVIPSTVEYDSQTYTVVAIAANAFYCNWEITSVVLPPSVTRLGEDCFVDCKLIETVDIQGAIEPDGFGFRAFQHCSSLHTLSIGEGTTVIGLRAFSSAESLTTVNLPSTLITIQQDGFAGTAFEEIDLPYGLRTIEAGVFAESGLKQIVLPDSVDYVGPAAFAWSHNFASVKLSESLSMISAQTFEECDALEEVWIPASVGSVGVYAFARAANLRKMVFVDSDAPFFAPDWSGTWVAQFPPREADDTGKVYVPAGSKDDYMYIIEESVNWEILEVCEVTTSYNSVGGSVSIDFDPADGFYPGTYSFVEGEDVYVDIVPEEGYVIGTVANAVSVEGVPDRYVIEGIGGNTEVAVTFRLLEAHVLAFTPSTDPLEVRVDDTSFTSPTVDECGYCHTDEIAYSSSNTSVAMVDPLTGELTLVGVGDAVITVTVAANSDCLEGSASYAVKVLPTLAAPHVTFSPAPPTSLTIGQTGYVSPGALSDCGYNDDIVYTSSDESVLTVDPATGEITIVGVGAATIKASLAAHGDCLDAEASYTVTVVPKAAVTSSGGGSGTVLPSTAPSAAPKASESAAPKASESAAPTVSEEVTPTDTATENPFDDDLEDGTDDVELDDWTTGDDVVLEAQDIQSVGLASKTYESANGATVVTERFTLEQLPEGYSVEQIGLEEFMIFDETGTPVGSIKVPEGKTLEEMDVLLEMSPMTLSVKSNPKTGDIGVSVGVLFLGLVTAFMVTVTMKRRKA